MGHLTAEQITACRDGETRDASIEQHLAECSRCRSRLAESRLFGMLLAAAPRQRKLTRHPVAETLAAYFDQALPPRETAKIELHLRNCNECMADLVALRRASSMKTEETPPPALSARVRRRFAAHHGRSHLGRLLVEVIEGWVRLERYTYALKSMRPRAPAMRTLSAAADMMVAESPAFLQPPPPPRRELAFGELASTHDKTDPLEGAIAYRMGSVSLTVQGRRLQEGVELAIHAREAATNQPRIDLPVTLEPPQGSVQEVKTDAQGNAVLQVAPGSSRLLVNTPERVWELEIDFPLPPKKKQQHV